MKYNVKMRSFGEGATFVHLDVVDGYLDESAETFPRFIIYCLSA